MKITFYKLFKKGHFTSKTRSIKVAKNLQQLGWDYVTVTHYL